MTAQPSTNTGTGNSTDDSTGDDTPGHDQTGSRGDALVMFGLTGDLGEKKLFPAIYELAAAGRLDLPVIGVGRTEYTDDEFSEMFRRALAGSDVTDGSSVDQDVVDRIDIRYVSGDSTEPATYDELADLIGDARNPVVYAALPPSIFAGVATGIADSSLPDSTRLVVEKPFGDGAEDARALYEEIGAALHPERLFIVDHFLAKASVENMSVARHANALLENNLTTQYVESLDIVMSEKGGVDGRGSFYEGVGAIKDVVQNHLLQMLAMVTMEAPADDSDESFHAARADLLRAVVAADPDDAVLGQYDGYQDLDDVDDDSRVETFASIGLSIDNERWAGVPIRLRTGKELDESRTEAVFTLRNGADSPNRIRFTVKPDASIAFDLNVLDPQRHEPTPTTMYACGPDDHGALGDYAVMLDNALDGVRRHFAQIDGIVEAWRIVEPIVHADLDLVVYPTSSCIDDVGSGPADDAD